MPARWGGMTGIVPFLIFSGIGLAVLVGYALLGEVIRRKRGGSDDI